MRGSNRQDRLVWSGSGAVPLGYGLTFARFRRHETQRRADEAGTPAARPRADPPRQHLADGAPLRGALPMMCLRVMPLRRCENYVGGRFTVCPVPDSHETRRVSAEAAASYAGESYRSEGAPIP